MFAHWGVALALTLPPAGAAFDYQLGGPSTPEAGVTMVVRDRTADPEPGLYNVCYVNGFQSQPGQARFWRKRSALVLHRKGKPVVDEAWGEWLLDIRTPDKRRRLAAIMGRWVRGCAADGYAAVEYDNLDSFSRSHGLISARHAKKYAALLVRAAHDAGLAAAQKNWAQWDGTRVGFDFAIAESCARWDECGDYVASYGALVYDIEYRDRDFARACRDHGGEISIVRRDLALAPGGHRAWCPSTLPR